MDSDPFTANATSRLSSDFHSAVSTSPLEQSLHNVGHLERACSAPLAFTGVTILYYMAIKVRGGRHPLTIAAEGQEIAHLMT